MAVGAFPLIKLGALAVRQVSKPLANWMKNRAKNSHFFRVYICMPPAQIYHYFEVNVKMKLLGLGKPSNVNKLNETAAIELGAELLGESIIFLVAVLTLSAEYYRQSKNSAAQAQVLEERWNNTERRIQELEFLTEKQRTEIRELTRLIHSNQSSIRSIRLWSSSPPTEPKPSEEDPTPSPTTTDKGGLDSAIKESLDKLNLKKQ